MIRHHLFKMLKAATSLIVLIGLAAAQPAADPTKLDGIWSRATPSTVWLKHYFGNRFNLICIDRQTGDVTHQRAGDYFTQDGIITETSKILTYNWKSLLNIPAKLVFSVDGQSLATEDEDGRRVIWERQPEEALSTPGLQFSGDASALDGIWVGTNGDTKTIKIYAHGRVTCLFIWTMITDEGWRNEGRKIDYSQHVLTGIYRFDGTTCKQVFTSTTPKRRHFRGVKPIEMKITFIDKNHFVQTMPDGSGKTEWRQISPKP